MVKTRLARNLTEMAVIDLYRCLLDDTIDLAKGLVGVDVAMVCPECDVEDLARATSNKVRVVAQSGKGLAAGLTSVFAHFSSAGARRIVAFNSDTPHLAASVLQDAFSLLAECDVVVGPTRDGGYYLVGATAAHPGLFSGDAMGTTNAYDALLKRARGLDLSVALTDLFYDIDEVADLGELAAELQHAPGKAPRTAEWLARIKDLRLIGPSGGAA